MRTIAHISDLHFGRHSPAAVEALLAALAEAKPDLVAVSGDLTQRARRPEFAEARAFLDRIAFPLLVVPGNHDIPLYDVFGRLFRPFAKYRSAIAPKGASEPLFADDEIAVLGLNTVRRFTGKNGRVSHRQVAEVGRVFGPAAPPSLFRVIVTHHPLGLPEGGVRVDLAGRAELALRTVAAAGVHLLLSGHYHRSASGGIDAERAAGGTVLIVHAGTAVSTRTRGGEANSFNLVRIDPPNLVVRVMTQAGETGFVEGATAAYRLEDGRWLKAV